MGFLSSITGGGKSGGSSGGYGALPKFQQQALKSQAAGVSKYIDPFGDGNIDRFTPLGETADETRAYDLIRQGFTPTAETLGADLNMLQNPYLSSVISEINRQGQGANSVLQQNLNGAGQFNSNRSILGASDIDLARTNQIGGFLSDNYNTNLNYALNTLPALRAADATGLAGIGADQRALDYQINQAPVTALQTQAGILSGFPYSLFQPQAKTGGSSLGSTLQGVGSLASAASSIFGSDKYIKENIEEHGIENGHKTYSFTYKGDPEKTKHIGVLAQEVMETNPEAVHMMDNGFYAVDYAKIGVNFRHAD